MKIKETPALTIRRRKYTMDLVPSALIVARYFAFEQGVIESVQAKKEPVSRELEEFVEEHTSEGSLLKEALNDKGNGTKASLQGQFRAIRDDGDPESDDEQDILMYCLALIEVESEASNAVKEAQTELDQRLMSRYVTLTEIEIKTLVIENKWFASILATVNGEIQRLIQHLTTRVQNWKERYTKRLPDLERDVVAYRAKMKGHLRGIGLSV